MNLIQKLITYIHLRRNHVRNAWTYSPLVKFDYWLIAGILSLIALLAFISHKHNQDVMYVSIQQEKQLQTLKTALARQNNAHLEAVIVSILNGRVKIDGIHRAICVLDVNGECV